MIENFRDVSHFAFVHQATLGAMPEVIEPLEPESNGLEVILRRKMEWGEDASAVWGALREMHYHAIAPNFISAQILTDDGERCLLHAARAISATESAHYWIEGGLENFDAQDLEELIDYRLAHLHRGSADHLGDPAARAAARPQRRRQHPRRPLHPGLPRRLPRVRRTRPQPARGS